MKKFVVFYDVKKSYSTTIEAENEEEALEIAEENWCDFDEGNWNECEEKVINVEIEQMHK